MRYSLFTALAALALDVVAIPSPKSPLLPSRTQLDAKAATPASPGFEFLYTLNCTLGSIIPVGNGPKGTRTVIPITGGWFEGPKLRGQVLNLGADWSLTDNRGVSHPDTRYGLRTADGADIFIQTFGSTQNDGLIHLHGVYETGSDKYWWLNDIVAIGMLHFGMGPWVKIDMWYTTSPTNKTV